ncbi:MAG: Fic family protein [Bacteroidetes bacterium]|nr:Fic family protein [Bacteroidota bacterium]
MAKSIRNAEKALQHLQEIIQRFPEGISFQALRTNYGGPINERTLRRDLTLLQKEGKIDTTGNTRSRLYHWVWKTAPAVSTVRIAETKIPLSKEGEKIKEAVELPQGNRTPVSYNAGFLKKYRTNHDFYLTKKERGRLLQLGQTSQNNQPAGTYARQILQRLLIDLSWNSSRLEGNTYSLLDTQRLLAQGQIASDRSATDAQMILNHKEAIEFLVDATEDIGFNRYTITNLHGLLSNNLLDDPGASGRLRTFAVGITTSVYTPLAIPQQIEEYFELILTKARQIKDPFEQAFFVMVHIPYLQPFDDVNKRVSRLAANIPLNKHNLAPLSFVDVPQDLYIEGLLGVYELQSVALMKDVFLWAYERSCLRYAAIRQSLGEPDPFRLQYRDAIRDLIKSVITEAMTQIEARRQIEKEAAEIPKGGRTHFIEIVETELLSLHPGNIARYRIRPSEFAAWQRAWNKH